jgi:RNA polymerase sigma-70 factor (ECF subfamily)
VQLLASGCVFRLESSNNTSINPAKPQTHIITWDIDRELAARVRPGNNVAFELLVVKHQRRVAALIRSLVRRADVTEELTQEVFLNTYDHLADLHDGAVFWSWLSTIARNVASGYVRRPQNRIDQGASGADPDTEESDSLQFAASAEQDAMAKELFAMIDSVVAELPAKQRDALLLREVDGLDYSVIAATLGVPVNTVRILARLAAHRARSEDL